MILRIRKSQQRNDSVAGFDPIYTHVFVFRVPITIIVEELRPITGENRTASATIGRRNKTDFCFEMGSYI
jgi:hypothetical protein